MNEMNTKQKAELLAIKQDITEVYPILFEGGKLCEKLKSWEARLQALADAEPDREAEVERMKGLVHTEPAKEGDEVVTYHGVKAGTALSNKQMPTIRLRAAQISQAEGGVRVGDNYFFAGEWRRNPMSTTRDAIGIEDRITKRFETLGD